MKKIDSKFLKELPPLFQHIKIKKIKMPTQHIHSGKASVKKLNSTQVDCENFHRPISKIMILTDEV